MQDGWFSTTVTYRNDATAVVARADWRDSLVDVFLVELQEGAIPLYVNGVSNSLAPSLVLDLTDDAKRAPILADPRDSEQTRRLLEWEAEALRLCNDALRGDFTRFHRAVARLAEER